jgi:hypothetical protein
MNVEIGCTSCGIHYSEFLNTLSPLLLQLDFYFLLLLATGDSALESFGPETGFEEVESHFLQADFWPTSVLEAYLPGSP